MLLENETWALHGIQGEVLMEVKTGDVTTQKRISVEQLSEAMGQQQMDSGWVGDSIQRMGWSLGEPWFLAYHPPGIQDARFAVRKLKLSTPGFVFAGRARSYWLFMQTDWEKEFMPDLRLVAAPFPNVHPDGQICWGDNPTLLARTENASEMWRLFWRAPFNDDLDDLRKQNLLREMKTAGETGTPSPAYLQELEAMKKGRKQKRYTPASICDSLMQKGRRGDDA
jgi:hypothetical protein